MLSRLLLFAALIGAVVSCGAPTSTSSADNAPPEQSAQANPGPLPTEADPDGGYTPWGDTRESTCAHMREEIAAGRPGGEGPPSERPYEPGHRPGLAALALTPTSATTARRIFGEPCVNIANVWAVPISAFELEITDSDAFNDYVVVLRPMTLRLPDGRDVVLAPIRPGEAHATNGFYAALILGGAQRRPFAMDGGGTFGEPGTLSVPRQQPPGAFHVWLEGGGTWQGYTQGWAAITDFAGAAPQARGRFRTYGYSPCDSYAQQQSGDRLCRGTREYALTSVAYSEGGADQLTVTWEMETYDQAAGDRKVNRQTRTLVARYELRGGVYRLVEGEEPPRV